jgi:hypothetical protein
MIARQPILSPVPIVDLRPTQVTVGYREVQMKRRRFQRLGAEAGGAFLGRHVIPAVLGPKGRHFIIDNHHLARALREERVESVLVSVAADLSALSKASFWRFLDNRAWCHPYDANGERTDFKAIPSAIDDLEDDPYRSLAGELRHAGGYAKDLTPFSEFLWADFLRGRIKRAAVEAEFDTALARSLKLAKSQDAAFLPGWCGADREPG